MNFVILIAYSADLLDFVHPQFRNHDYNNYLYNEEIQYNSTTIWTPIQLL